MHVLVPCFLTAHESHTCAACLISRPHCRMDWMWYKKATLEIVALHVENIHTWS